MSNFSKEQLYQIYGEYLPSFIRLAQLSNEYDVHFELDVSPSGNIKFHSREYATENNKDICRSHVITQGKNHVSDGNRTTILREN